MSSETTDDADECKYVRDQPFAEECKEALRAAANDIHGEVTVKRYNQWAAAQSDKVPSQDQIERELEGRFYDVCDTLGIPTNETSRHYSDDEIFSAVKQAADEVRGESLTIDKYRNWREKTSQRHPTIQTIYDRFTWSNVCERVGVEHGGGGGIEDKYTSEDIYSAIRQAAADEGEPLTMEKYSEWRKRRKQKEPSTGTIRRREEGWAKACERADVEHSGAERSSQPFSMKEIEMAVQLAAEICGEPLTGAEYEAWQEDADYPYPAAGTIISRAKWCDVCERAGVESAGETYSEQDIITAIKQAVSDCGEPLTREKYREWRENVDDKYPAGNTIVKRIGWSEACEQAGVSYGYETTND